MMGAAVARAAAAAARRRRRTLDSCQFGRKGKKGDGLGKWDRREAKLSSDQNVSLYLYLDLYTKGTVITAYMKYAFAYGSLDDDHAFSPLLVLATLSRYFSALWKKYRPHF